MEAILRKYIRNIVSEWHDHLDMVMATQDEENLKSKKKKAKKLNKDPSDPYHNSSETRGKKPNPLATSRAAVHKDNLSQKAGVGFGSGPQSGRFPGGKNQGFSSSF